MGRALLVVAGVGTALVLTGGNLYLAHTIASVRRWRGRLAVVWLAVLVSSGGLVVPLIAAGLGGRKLPQVLAGETQAWPGRCWRHSLTRSPPPAACWRPRRRVSGRCLAAKGAARSTRCWRN